MTRPPGNSLAGDQQRQVAPAGPELADGLRELLDRIGQELGYNDAKGGSAYRLGMHDGLRFAEDAVVYLLRRHGHPAEASSRPTDA